MTVVFSRRSSTRSCATRRGWSRPRGEGWNAARQMKSDERRTLLYDLDNTIQRLSAKVGQGVLEGQSRMPTARHSSVTVSVTCRTLGKGPK